MKRILLLVAALPCAAFAQTQFQPPGGLPLSTQVGTVKNGDGTASVTLGSMQSGISANSSGIASLQSSSVSHNDLSSALASYLTQSASDAKYATQTALSSEVSRAQAAEQSNASAISAMQSDYITSGALNGALGSYVTGAALSSALSGYLTQSQAAQTYLPLRALDNPLTLGSDLNVSGDAYFSNNIRVNKIIYTSSTSNTNGQWSGQGFGIDWNTAKPGTGAAEIVNVSPGVRGGLIIYSINTNDTITSSTTPLMDISWSEGAKIGTLTGSGNAYVCVNSSGQLYRSASACQ